jgi:membrane protease YdiL (CAAX protease family)
VNRSAGQWTRLLLGVLVVFAVFHWSAAALGSDRGQAGMLVAALVVGLTLTIERAWSGRPVVECARAIGLGRPRFQGLAVAVGVCALLLLVVPAFARVTGASATIAPDAAALLPGLFAQAGIAEETLFRGFLFGRVRRGRSFWTAAGWSMLPFVAVHLLLFVTMPWPIALAALFLAVVTSFPFAHLYELGGSTIWAPALLHFVVQATVKIVVIDEPAAASFPLVWMVAAAVVPMLALIVPRPERSRLYYISRFDTI